MANITKIQDEIAHDEIATPVPIKQKDGEFYLAASSTTEAPVPVTIDVLGVDAKRVQAAKDKIQRRMLRQRRATLDPADIRANRVEAAAAAVTGWSGWTCGDDDAPFPYSPENAAALLGADHILEQVEAAVVGHSDFFTSASRT